jgi:hypothetical protein
LDALEAMGARAQHQILTEMIAWVEAHPEEASAQTGFDVRAEPLDELDAVLCGGGRDADRAAGRRLDRGLAGA